MTPAEGDCADGPGHAWMHGQIGWTVAFWLLLALSTAVLLIDDLDPARRTLGLAGIVAMGVAHLVLRPAPGPRLTRRNLVYLVVVIVAVLPAIAADSSLSLVLVVLYPQMWTYGGPTRSSVGFSVALSAGFALGLLVNIGFSAETVAGVLPAFLITSASSIAMGMWISRIIDQSRDRARLITVLEATRSELGEAQHARGVLAERERVAREVHDTLAQGFTSIIMLAQAGPSQLGTIEAVARENLAEARALVAAFSPVGLTDSTLTEALHRLATRFTAETGVAVSVTGELAALPRDHEVVLLRAAQEALANVRRHARASSVTVRLAGSSVEVLDDGIGFRPDAAAGFGLSGMQSRVSEAGGSVSVTSVPGSGTQVRVEVPA